MLGQSRFVFRPWHDTAVAILSIVQEQAGQFWKLREGCCRGGEEAQSAMYSWGGASNGELGVGGLEDAYVSSPTPTVWPLGTKVTDIAPGGRHTHTCILFSCIGLTIEMQ